MTEVVASTGTATSTYNYGSINVQPGITYAVKVEILRNDLGSSGERVRDITLDGKGRCTYDVCTERGGEGDWPKYDQRKEGCVDLVLTRGGRGSKITKSQQTS